MMVKLNDQAKAYMERLGCKELVLGVEEYTS